MASEKVSWSRIPPAAFAAIAACLFGFMYAFSFRGLLEAQHWFSFSAPEGMTLEEFNSAVTFITISLFVYYSLFLAAAVLLILRSRRSMMITLLVMAGVRLVVLILMFRPGYLLVFQQGFEMILEIVALLCTVYIYKNVGKNKKLYDSRITVCVLAVMAEAVPLLRNFQYLFMPDVTLGAKISAIMLPCFTAIFLSFMAFRSAGRRPVFFRNEDMEEAMAEAAEEESEEASPEFDEVMEEEDPEDEAADMTAGQPSAAVPSEEPAEDPPAPKEAARPAVKVQVMVAGGKASRTAVKRPAADPSAVKKPSPEETVVSGSEEAPDPTPES